MQAVTCARGCVCSPSALVRLQLAAVTLHTCCQAAATKLSPLNCQVHVSVGKRPISLSTGCSCHHGLFNTFPQR